MKSLMISDIKHLREDKHDANDNLLTKMLTKKVEDIKVDIGYPEELNPNEFLTVMYGDWNKLNEILRGGGNYIISIMPYLLQQKVFDVFFYVYVCMCVYVCICVCVWLCVFVCRIFE
eukprot:GHVR01123289.1.p1 GENE.GHVR01123289.1~~GHVR01123289.1.p1  ORF type:complete len:117 (+),score=32.46 GHVR01123289.1:169-519(+)